jgi:hypothetical protein
MGKYYKILLISVGFLLGIILGGLIVYFVLGGSIKNIYVFNQPPKSVEEKKYTVKDEKSQEKAASKVVIKYLKKDDTPKDENNESVKELESDTSLQKQNSISITNSIEEEEIIVKKDEMLFSEMLMIINLDSVKTNKGDSLAKLAANIKEPAINQFCQVEYWKSPLNYRGYKFSKNKLVVYGIEYVDKDSIFRWKDNFYFKANNRIYELEKTPEFKTLEIANNPELLNLIEKK